MKAVCKLLCDPDVVDSEVAYFMQRFDHDGDGVVTLDEVSRPGLPASRPPAHIWVLGSAALKHHSTLAVRVYSNNKSRSKTCLKPQTTNLMTQTSNLKRALLCLHAT